MVQLRLRLSALLVVVASSGMIGFAEARSGDSFDTINEYAAARRLGHECAIPALGRAAPFTVVVFGDVVQSGTATTGRMAVGGSATLIDFGIGSQVPAGSDQEDTLIVQGRLNYSGGHVASGNVATGGPATLHDVSFAPGFGHRDAVPVDFEALESYLHSLSKAYARMPANGESIVRHGQVELIGHDAKRNIFSILETVLVGADSVTITVPAGSEVIVNVVGTSPSLANIGLHLSGVDGDHVLINAAEAATLSLSEVGMAASILAPSADINFDNGSIHGTVIGASLTGSGTINSSPFAGCASLFLLIPSTIYDMPFAILMQ